ncbi:MAG: SpaA isopeptide-forming pilin-related protein [Bacilli bacterium]
MLKKIMKNLAMFAVILFIGTEVVYAAPSSIKVTSKGKMDLGVGYYFPMKYTEDGRVAYCTEFRDNYPMGITMSNPKKVDAGLAYIIENGFKGYASDYNNDSKFRQYYITQMAVYYYRGEIAYKTNHANYSELKEAKALADRASSVQNKTIKISLNSNSSRMTLTTDNKYFISDKITITSNQDVTLNLAVSANTGAVVIDSNGNAKNTVKNGDVVYVRMPSSVINAGQKIKLALSVKGTITNTVAYEYFPGDAGYQNIVPDASYKESISDTATINLEASKEKLVTKTKISKQDITTKEELPGASLELKDASGNVILSWVSGTTPKYIEGLKAGSYSLCETAAPAGYELYKECINFQVREDGTTSTVIMYNKQKSEVIISKQDITNKQELPGAKLEIKDANGNVKISWTSGTTPKRIKGLKVGSYSLCETAAPAGYDLYKECINFEIKADGKVPTVVMYNRPTKKEVTKVKISKQDITNNKELPGATLVVKDLNGNVVETWVSTNEPKYIEGLKVGSYTLCETAAPAGYDLYTECIKFDVLNNGTVTNVVMYNTPTKEVTKVKISKQDITNKQELPGATLVIKNSAGEVVETWVSTNEPKYIEGMKPGKYTLEETIAPDGYILSTEKREFTVKEDSTVTTVTFFNEKEKSNKVRISKKDIATKEELPGATLEVKDSNGNVVETWVSESTAHELVLKPGTYTLTETQAPVGYILSTESITFVVNEDGTVDSEIVLFNTRAVEVPITDANISSFLYLIGIAGIILGFVKVYKNAKN